MQATATIVWRAMMVYTIVGVAGCASLQSPHPSVVSINLQDAWSKADKLNRQGVDHLNANNQRLAEESFRRAIHINEGHGGAHNNLGLMYYRRRKLVRAADEFQKAIEFMPGNASPVNALGMTLEAGGRMDEAIELYRQANQMAPTNPLFLGNLVRAKLRAGYHDDLIISQLRELLMYETRCEWVDWVKEQLEIHLNPNLDRGPSGPDDSLSNKPTEEDTYSAHGDTVLMAPQTNGAAASEAYVPTESYPTDAIWDSSQQEIILEPAHPDAMELPSPMGVIQQQSGIEPIEGASNLIQVDVDDLER